MPVSRHAIITFFEDGERPDNSLPGGGGYPGHALPPAPGRPDNSLPWAPHLPVHLPVFPFDPTLPDNSLPGGPPPSTLPIRPGAKFVVKWLACSGLILVPDHSLPTPPPVTPGNELPGGPPLTPGTPLPPTAEPKLYGG